MMPHTKAAGAAAVRPEPDPEPLAVWTRGEDKLLEMLIVRYFSRCDWDIMASRLVGKTPEQVSRRYERTVDEVTRALNSLQVETPREWDVQVDVIASPAEKAADVTAASSGEEAAPAAENARVPAASSAADCEPSELGAVKRKPGGKRRNKPVKWTEEEHNLFLEGLEKYGEGKWKTMATEYLTTKTAIQIASHNQKHHKRLEQKKRNGCKRASIHDITEPTRAAAAAAAAAVAADDGEPAGQNEDELGRDVVKPKAPGELVGALEEFPGQYDLGPLFM